MMIAVHANRVSKHKAVTTARDAKRKCLFATTSAVQGAKKALSISQAAKHYNIPKSTLFNQLQGKQDQVLYIRSRQKLSTEKKDCLKN